MSAATMDLNRKVVAELVAEAAGGTMADRQSPMVETAPMSERELQARCEAHLEECGLRRLTAENASKGGAVVGWFGHLGEARGNPLMPDLFIFDDSGYRAPLLVELKARPVYQPGQRELIGRGLWVECRRFEDFALALANWRMRNCVEFRIWVERSRDGKPL
ncbi:MAG: hypothetical protein KJ579_07325 [Verrucomicrobia bacterium]|nr:hypothetical protein [Verrucomicrobiota bacterium]